MTISMLIISAIGAVAGRAFLQVLKVNNELHSRAEVFGSARLATDELRRTISNLLPGEICQFSPYSEGIDKDTGAPTYCFLTRVPENSPGGSPPDCFQATLVELKIQGGPEEGFSLAIVKRFVGLDGSLSERMEGVLSTGLEHFRISPEYGRNDTGSEELIAFEIDQSYALPYDSCYAVSIRLPVGNKPKKQENK